jgi:hypothetical protein
MTAPQVRECVGVWGGWTVRQTVHTVWQPVWTAPGDSGTGGSDSAAGESVLSSKAYHLARLPSTAHPAAHPAHPAERRSAGAGAGSTTSPPSTAGSAKEHSSAPAFKLFRTLSKSADEGASSGAGAGTGAGGGAHHDHRGTCALLQLYHERPGILEPQALAMRPDKAVATKA